MIMNEKELVRLMCEELSQNKPSDLKKVENFVNLAIKGFEGIWSGWYKGQTPPKLEIDMIFAFEDFNRRIDDALIIGIEVKYFKELRGFYEGLGQILSYSIFGLDGLSLWHLFSEDVEDEEIQPFANAVIEIIRGLNLPLFYLCGKITDESPLKIRCFEPSVIMAGRDVNFFAGWMRDYCREIRNSLLFESKPLGPSLEEIRKRRSTLKVMLKIP